MSSAVIIRTHLPTGLERLRRRSVADAAIGVPAHVTLLYPFVEPGRLDPSIRPRIATIARRHPPFDYTLVGRASWPDTTYVAVEPAAPARATALEVIATGVDGRWRTLWRIGLGRDASG